MIIGAATEVQRNSGHPLGERPTPIFTPAGRHRRDTHDTVALAVTPSGSETVGMRTRPLGA
jgi:hypothetical protein